MIIAMNKIFKLFLIAATVVASIASCQKTESEVLTPEDVKYTFLIGNADETKATIGETCVVWEEGDQLGTYTTSTTPSINKFSIVTPGNPASFAIYASGGLKEGDMIYCYYPYSSAAGSSSTSVSMSIPVSQNGTDAMPMVSAPFTVTEDSDENQTPYSGEIRFYNLGSVIEFNIYSMTETYQEEKVRYVMFDSNDPIAGKFKVDLTAVNDENLTIDDYEENVVTASLSTPIAVSPDKNAATIVKMVIAPGTHAGNITVATDKATYTYGMGEKEFKRSFVKPLAINLKADNRSELTDYSGDWFITGTASAQLYAAKSWADGNNLSAYPISMTDDKVNEADYADITDCKMTITRIESGDYEGMYTIQDANGKYLYAASSSSNHLKASATIEDSYKNNYYWDITSLGGNHLITAAKSDNNNNMRFNSVNKLFSCYSSGQNDLRLYPYAIIEDLTPRIFVSETAIEVSAAAEALEIPFTVNRHVDGIVSADVKDGATMTDISAEVVDNKMLNVTFAVNEDSDPKTATIVLSYEGAEDVEVTITQAGFVAGQFIDVLNGEFTGITGTSYTQWSGLRAASPAIYAGQSAGRYESIQLRATSPSGIITTASGGKVKKIAVSWNGNTEIGRTLVVYGKNTSYNASTELYGDAKGDVLGTIICGTLSTELSVDGDYEYIGLKSDSGAMYLDAITITWEN